ncbi:HIPL2 protein [Planoprotostelium fungivorum]|uniref:HIPL2 protein n=1 Tax=Planoprotostelium fungivorum TaxID=1890364 RepID=A0A2P6NPV4_9EUKA|nr:HIPL2 protein [Planoprotostelium fungivorum]
MEPVIRILTVFVFYQGCTGLSSFYQANDFTTLPVTWFNFSSSISPSSTVCIYPTGNKGQQPQPASLTFCTQYSSKTCCSADYAQWIDSESQLSTIYGSQCSSLLRSLACSVCNPLVGLGQYDFTLPCKPICNQIWDSCGSTGVERYVYPFNSSSNAVGYIVGGSNSVGAANNYFSVEEWFSSYLLAPPGTRNCYKWYDSTFDSSNLTNCYSFNNTPKLVVSYQLAFILISENAMVTRGKSIPGRMVLAVLKVLKKI